MVRCWKKFPFLLNWNGYGLLKLECSHLQIESNRVGSNQIESNGYFMLDYVLNSLKQLWLLCAWTLCHRSFNAHNSFEIALNSLYFAVFFSLLLEQSNCVKCLHNSNTIKFIIFFYNPNSFSNSNSNWSHIELVQCTEAKWQTDLIFVSTFCQWFHVPPLMLLLSNAHGSICTKWTMCLCICASISIYIHWPIQC